MLYLIHLDGEGLVIDQARTARHYIGFVDGPQRIADRMQLHRSGRGARFLKAANEQGKHWRLVAVYRGSRDDERALKNQNNSARYCPVCNLNPAVNPRADAVSRRRALGLPVPGPRGIQAATDLYDSLQRLQLGHLYPLLKEYA